MKDGEVSIEYAVGLPHQAPPGSEVQRVKRQVQPAMSLEDEQRLGTADIVTGVAGTILLVSGYYPMERDGIFTVTNPSFG